VEGEASKIKSGRNVWNEVNPKSRVNKGLLVKEMGTGFTSSTLLLECRVVSRPATTIYPAADTTVLQRHNHFMKSNVQG
jgi:hypothetical protein